MEIPFFRYPDVYGRHQEKLDQIFVDVGRRGAFILQKELRDFEQNIVEYTGAKYALGVGNATDAMLLGYLATGLNPGDEVLFCSHTFVATAGAIHFAGGKPVPVEAGVDHLLDPSKLESAITAKTRYIVPTQLNGRICDMNRIQAVADKHGLRVAEDSAQGLGAKFKGRMAGTFGDFGCYSFYPAKNLGALGDAGIMVTNSEEIYQKALCLRDHGRDPQSGEVKFFGMNSRMDNLQAAFLNHIFQDYDSVVRLRRHIASRYNEGLSNIEELRLPPPPREDSDHFDVFQNYEIEAENRDELQEHLRSNGIGSLVQWGGKAVHQFEGLGLKGSLPFTEELFTRMLMLPLNLTLTDQEVAYVCSAIRDFYSGNR